MQISSFRFAFEFLVCIFEFAITSSFEFAIRILRMRNEFAFRMSFEFAIEKGLFMYFVYKHTCPNGKVYIGITGCTPEVRWQGGYGYKDNGRFFKDILYYGWGNIKHEILAEGLDKQEALQMESAQILLHNSQSPQYGYNQTSTDSSAHNIPIDKYSTDGTFICTYDSVKSAAKSVGTTSSSISKACYYNHVTRGYLWKFTEDKTPLIIPDNLSRRIHKPHRSRTDIQGKAIAQYTKDGVLIKIYDSIQDAHKQTGINRGSICSCCKGQKGSGGRKVHSAGGYVWKYIET